MLSTGTQTDELKLRKKTICFPFDVLRKSHFSMEYKTTIFTRCRQLESERILQTNNDE